MLVSQANIVTIPLVVSPRKRTAASVSTVTNPIIGLERARQMLADLKLAYNQLSSECRSVVREQLATCASYIPASESECGNG